MCSAWPQGAEQEQWVETARRVKWCNSRKTSLIIRIIEKGNRKEGGREEQGKEGDKEGERQGAYTHRFQWTNLQRRVTCLLRAGGEHSPGVGNSSRLPVTENKMSYRLSHPGLA